MVNRKEDWQAAFGQPSASFDTRIQQTLEHLEEEKTMKKFTLRTILIAAALLLAVIGTVYAATGGWSIGDYFDHVYGNNDAINVPKDFASGFDQILVQQAGEVVFTIRDAYLDDTQLQAVVTFARADGRPALFLAAMLTPEDAMTNFFHDGRKDSRTIAEYAADNGLPIHEVNTCFEQDGIRSGSMDIWLEEDGTTAAFVTAETVRSPDGSASLVWQVLTYDEQGKKQRSTQEIHLKTEPIKAWEVPVNQPVEGLPLTVDRLYIRENQMGLHVDIAFSINRTQAADDEILALLEGIRFEMIDPETGMTMPGGATTFGSIDAVNEEETAFLQRGESLSTAFDGDMLYLRAYDAQKNRYGTVAVKIK